MSSSLMASTSRPCPFSRCRACRSSFGASRSEPFWIWREFDTIDVPIWPGHHHRAFDMRCVETEVVDEGFGKSLHREFRGAVGRVRHAHADAGPKAVDAGGVDDMRLV